ncbi:MAG: hypothetical protein ACFB0C_19505 [Leptolyngbyaceae cyanobacterium]
MRADLRLQAEAHAPTASVAAAIYRVHGNKGIYDRMFNPAAAQLFVLEARERVRPEVARTFMQLLEAGQLPGWVPAAVGDEMAVIEAAAGD